MSLAIYIAKVGALQMPQYWMCSAATHPRIFHKHRGLPEQSFVDSTPDVPVIRRKEHDLP